MECIGVNPWKEKPAGWSPPTEEECAHIEKILGGEVSNATATPVTNTEGMTSLIADEARLNNECRDGSGDNPKTMKACEERDVLFQKIKAKGLCWGHEGQIEADKAWSRVRSD